MEKVDLVMVGAEGVAESGGVINKVESLGCLATTLTTDTSIDWDVSDVGIGQDL